MLTNRFPQRSHLCSPGPLQLVLTWLGLPSLLPPCPSQGHTEPFGQEVSAKKEEAVEEEEENEEEVLEVDEA